MTKTKMQYNKCKHCQAKKMTELSKETYIKNDAFVPQIKRVYNFFLNHKMKYTASNIHMWINDNYKSMSLDSVNKRLSDLKVLGAISDRKIKDKTYYKFVKEITSFKPISKIDAYKIAISELTFNAELIEQRMNEIYLKQKI